MGAPDTSNTGKTDTQRIDTRLFRGTVGSKPGQWKPPDARGQPISLPPFIS